MQPVLWSFDLGGATVVIAAYGTLLTLAAVLALALGARGAGALGVAPRRALAGYGVAILAGLVGARLLDVVLNLDRYAADPGQVTAVAFRGFVLYGGLAAAAVAGLLMARRWRVSPWALADSAIPAVAAGVALARVGCFLNGCCAGAATDLPWGVAFPFGSGAWGAQVATGRLSLLDLGGGSEPVHPTQLYEIVAVLAAAALALRLRRAPVPAGTAALAFIAVFALARAGIQALREPLAAGPVPADAIPAIYLGVAAVLAVAAAARGNLRGRAASGAPAAGLAG